MARISNILNTIRNAIYGKEVRSSLANGLEAVNKEVEAATTLSDKTKQRQDNLELSWDTVVSETTDGAEVIEARVQSDGTVNKTLKRRLDKNEQDTKSKFEDVHEKVSSIEINVDNFGLDPTGEKDCSDAFSTMLTMIDVNNKIVFSSSGTYKFSKTVHLYPNQKIDFKHATIIHDETTTLFNVMFEEDAPVFIDNANIKMVKGSPQQVAFMLKRVSGGWFRDINLENGAYGFYAEQSHTYELNKIYHRNPLKAGIYHNGDGGCEMTWRDVQIVFVNFKGQYGIEIERTTIEDLGGYYWYNVLVVVNKPAGGYAEQGIYVHGPIGKRATNVINLVGGGSDGFDVTDAQNGRYALKLENSASHRISQGWVTSIGLVNTDGTIISNLNVPQGIYFEKDNNAVNVSAVQIGETTAFNFKDTATVSNFIHSNIRTNGQLSNNYKKLTEYAAAYDKVIFTDREYGQGAIQIVDSHDLNNKFYVRIDAFGQLVILDRNLGTPVLQLSQTGTIRLPKDGTVIIGGKQVLGEVRGGWENVPTGAANRGGWNTETASVQQVAGAVRALIEDLRAHGLIT